VKDYYRILEVHAKASLEVIKKAYQTLALKYHPDRHKISRKQWAEEKFKQLSEAYQILTDPVKRREFDRSGYVQNLADTKIDEIMEEEAYFYLRMGIEHYIKSTERNSFGILFGRKISDLKKAKEDLKTVLNEYPNSNHVEDAHYYYLLSSMAQFEYSMDYITDLEEMFEKFLNQFSKSRWFSDVRILFAKFYLFKKRDYKNAVMQLNELERLYPETKIACDADVLLSYIQQNNKTLSL